MAGGADIHSLGKVRLMLACYSGVSLLTPNDDFSGINSLQKRIPNVLWQKRLLRLSSCPISLTAHSWWTPNANRCRKSSKVLTCILDSLYLRDTLP
jgi:hypothetical protein